MTVAALVLSGALAGCGDVTDQASETQGALGGSLRNTDQARFNEAKANFALTETQEDGLGPIFNERSCSQCHSNSTIGGAGQQIERRYGTFTNGVFNGLPNTGGSLRQLFSIGGYQDASGTNCQSGTDVLPAAATIRDSGRLTTPVFGLGLVEALADSVFTNIANGQPAAIRGTVNFTTVALSDGPMARGQRHVARFGWKAAHASLADFAGDAYLNEMGITTTSCANGQVVTTFATENRANRAPSNAPTGSGAAACDDDKLAGTDEDFAEEEDGCAGGLTEAQDDVANFAFFMRNLADPERGIDNSNGRGEAEFNREGCNGCHVGTAFPNSRALNGRDFRPFSDFLVHDMGTLGDQIGNDGDSLARTRQMRTAPLWGLRFRNSLLHDGRTSDRAAAIRAHDGQGAAARNAFNAATAAQRSDLLTFLSSL